MNAAEVVLNVLKGSGWCQNVSRNALGEHCIMGAVNYLTAPAYDEREFTKACAEVICEQYPERAYYQHTGSPVSTIVHFNDNPDTTFEDVRVILEKVAAHG
jgi:hypothetical protein